MFSKTRKTSRRNAGKGLAAFFIAIVLIGALLAGCAEPAPAPTTPAPTTPAPTTPAPTTPAPAPAAEVINLKYSSPYMDVESPSKWGNHMCDLIEEYTSGRVKVERFTGGVLGTMPEHLGLCSSGAVEFVGLHVGLYGREMVLNACGQEGNQFADRQQSLENVINFRDTPEVKAIMEDEAQKSNIKIFYYNQAGPSGVMCHDPATSLADLKGRKISAWDEAGRAAWGDHFGCIPVNVQIPETYEGLSRGVIDCGFGAMAAHAMAKWYEVGKTYIDLRVNMCEMPMAINLNTWNSLPADIQEAVVKASLDTAYWSNELDEECCNEYFGIFEESGLSIVHLSPAEAQEYQEVSEEFNRKVVVAEAESAGCLDKVEILWKYWDEIYDNNNLVE